MPLEKQESIGGQAVIEGVMLRKKQEIATAIRLENKKIKVKKIALRKKPVWQRFFLIRGIVNLIEMLIIGYKELSWSAEQALGEEEIGGWWLVVSFILSVVLALTLFKFIPLLIASYLKSLGLTNNLLFNLVDGLSKILILFLYLLAISQWKDVKRIFQFHGAEHKTVACYEAKQALTWDNIKKHKKEHLRCGTNFIFLVFFLGIFIYSFIPNTINFFLNFLFRILLLPVLASVAYEIIKLSSLFKNKFLLKIILSPGLLLQRITTLEPKKDQVEVAVAALKKLVK